jgi:F-type H+-transporting ATPase subunit epsilon
MAHFHLEILTPEKRFFDGDCESLIVETPDGKRGILAHHTPMVVAVADGEMSFKAGGEWKKCFSTGGFAEVRPDGTVLNAQIVEWPGEMEARLADEKREQTEEHLRQEKSLREYNESRANIARAMVKLKTKHSINVD